MSSSTEWLCTSTWYSVLRPAPAKSACASHTACAEASKRKRQITIRLDTASVDYFKELAAPLGMPYQNLINLYLRAELRRAEKAACDSVAALEATQQDRERGESLNLGVRTASG